METQKPDIPHSNDLNSATTTPLKPLLKIPIKLVFKREVLTTKKAVEHLIDGTLKRKVCRYCLTITAPLSDLDQFMQIAENGALYRVTIRDIIASVYPFKAAEDRNFPNKICEKCLTKAIQSYRFVQQCEQSQRALKNCFEDIYEKLEKLDPVEPTKKRGRQKFNPNYNTLYTEHKNVIGYAEPVQHLINVSSVSLSKEPLMSELECKKCWQLLPNIEALAAHEKSHPNTMWFNCRTCGKSFPKKLHIKNHLRSHLMNTFELPKSINFVCKQCGHVSEDHNIHLQHIEKHKFQMVLEHLVERKMDKLCAVCLNKGAKMVEMDKTICLHGGYPELTGDRTLYNILGATVPEPNYKYQELIVSHKPKIMRITKKVKKLTEKNSVADKFLLSLPEIISKEKVNNTADYLFIFVGASSLNHPNIPEIEELGEESDKTTPESHNGNDSVESNNKTSNMGKPIEFIFSKPESVLNVNKILKEKTPMANEKVESVKFKLCDKCWVFKKHPTCSDCLIENEQVGMMKNKANVKLTDDRSNTAAPKACQYCWVFKTSGKCDFCKQIFVNEDTHVNNGTKKDSKDVSIDTNVAVKRKSNAESTTKPKKTKWQCKVCLATNDMDRKTCQCCHSEEINETVKVNFSCNFHNFINDSVQFEKTETSKEIISRSNEFDANHNNINLDNSNENKIGCTEEDNRISSVEPMESSNSLSDFPTINPATKLDTFMEQMDVVDKEERLPDDFNLSRSNHETIAINTTENDMLNPESTNVAIPPYSFNLIYPLSPTNSGPLQFHIGASNVKNKAANRATYADKRIKKLKAARK